jgi:hypothetical protein
MNLRAMPLKRHSKLMVGSDGRTLLSRLSNIRLTGIEALQQCPIAKRLRATLAMQKRLVVQACFCR